MPARDGGKTALSMQTGRAPMKAMARTFWYRRMLYEGRYASIGEMATIEKIERGYLGTLPRLTLLTPDIAEGILDERAPRAITLPALLNTFPMEWSVQATAAASRDP